MAERATDIGNTSGSLIISEDIAEMWRRVHKPTKSYRSRLWRGGVLASLVLILVSSLVLVYNVGGRTSSLFGIKKQKWNTFESSVQFRPSVEFSNGTDLIWQIPESPKAVLFIAHGCNGKAANFWDRSPDCPHCVGLPEERLVVLHGLNRRFAVLTVSSMGKCWSFKKEMENVKWIIGWWIKKHRLEKLPVMALGASSGGHFVSALAANMRFNSITLMIAEMKVNSMNLPKSYPPTLFVHMPKDRPRMKVIESNMEDLRQKGVIIKEVRCMEFPLTPTFLSDRIPGLDDSFSVMLFHLLREKDFIDEKGYMRNDGRSTRWNQALKEREPLTEKYEWLNHIQEELNLAYGYHEMTSLQSDEIFDWFESHMS